MKLIVKQSAPLFGDVNISGSKNSALPIMAASVLSGCKNVIKDIPILADTEYMKEILRELGCRIDGDVYDSSRLYSYDAPYESVKKLRGSFLLAAPVLARMGRARIPLPGGCPIGTRPIDLHLKGFAQMGATVDVLHGVVDLRCKKLKGCKIYLDFPSVGATENLIIAAATAKGETVIENSAEEPEIYDLCDFLNKQGADITINGGGTISVRGVDELHGCEHRIIPDRIEAGTFLLAFAVTHGHGRVINFVGEHQKPLLAKLEEMGVRIYCRENECIIDAKNDIISSSIKTLPYPGFPTDMQAQFMALLSSSKGTAMVVETVFENRFLHVGELMRMGATIRIDGRTAVVQGVDRLMGTKVEALDLRGGAALALAALAAEGETQIGGAEHIFRGYENFSQKLNKIGAKIEYLSE